MSCSKASANKIENIAYLVSQPDEKNKQNQGNQLSNVERNDTHQKLEVHNPSMTKSLPIPKQK